MIHIPIIVFLARTRIPLLSNLSRKWLVNYIMTLLDIQDGSAIVYYQEYDDILLQDPEYMRLYLIKMGHSVGFVNLKPKNPLVTVFVSYKYGEVAILMNN